MLSPDMMAKDKDRSFTFRVTEKTLKELDELRKKESDLPTRGEMLRRLVERATLASKKEK